MTLLTDTMNFSELRRVYSECFSLGYINSNAERSPIENRFVLISLICFIVYKSKQKNPDTTHYQMVMKLAEGLGLPDNFLKGLSIICEDFSYQCQSFPVFGLKGQDIIKEVRAILKSYVPF